MVSLNRKQLFPNVFYKSVSAYWPVAAGPFTYEVRAAGADPESQPVIQVKGNLAAGKAYTVAAVGRWTSCRGAPAARRHGPVGAGQGQGALPGRRLSTCRRSTSPGQGRC